LFRRRMPAFNGTELKFDEWLDHLRHSTLSWNPPDSFGENYLLGTS
jgi:hypothetical protein